ncbi:MAG: type I restriction enzyme HsdR N-terminal domain-containing protein [Bacteroidetes bacterium]|nr:type I restriction enzyme HsdR N-terminal domain-containing protein [Bacteroidota bacterium]
MKPIPKRVNERLVRGIKKFHKILEDARSRDINESDTVVIITDMLSEIFGFDKYSEITSEFAIRGTYCDLATRIDGDLQYLIEVKAVGIELKESFIKQAVDYAANQGIDWVILTNGIRWIIYKIAFTKPIDKDQVIRFNFNELNPKNKSHLEIMFCLSKEGCNKSVLDEYHSQRQVLNKYFIGSVIITDPMLNTIRRELKKLAPDIGTDNEQIKKVISQEIFKREILESEKGQEASKKINYKIKKYQKAKDKVQEKKHTNKIEPEQQTQQSDKQDIDA